MTRFARLGRTPRRSRLGIRPGGGGAEVWTPADIESANILLGHEARAADLYTDAGTTPVASDGDAAYRWGEAYGPPGNFDQATLSLRPQWKPDYFASGKHAVLFDGTDDYMQRVLAADAQPHEIWIAGRMVTAGARVFLSGVSADEPAIQGSDNDGGIWVAYSGGFIAGGTRDTNNHVWRFIVNGASSDLEVDGESEAPGDAGALAGGLGLTIGASRTGAVPAHFAYAAVYKLDDQLSAGEAVSMRTHLQGLMAA